MTCTYHQLLRACFNFFFDYGLLNTLTLFAVDTTFLTLSLSNLDPGRKSGIPRNFLNLENLNALRTANWHPEVTSQYRLKATGKVIHMGMEIRGKILKNFENFLNCEFPPVVEVERILSSEKIPPTIGKIPVGSGEDKSVNQR